MSQTTNGDRFARWPVLPGAVVAVVALVSVDCAMTATSTLDRVQKTRLVAARAVVPSSASVLARVPSLTWTASALVILLLLGRQVVSLIPRPTTAGLVPAADNTGPALLLRSKTSISYHTGGLYGP